MEILVQTLLCFARLCLYIAPLAVIILGCRKILPVPRYIFRKMLHFIAFSCVTVMMYTAKTWLPVVLCAVLFAAVVYPILCVLEKRPWFASVLTEKKPGEIKASLLLLFLSQAVLIAFGWGLCGERWICAAATVIWGVGDTAAAVVGRNFGRHKTGISIADPAKTWEGTGANAAVSFVVCAVILFLLSPLTLPQILLYAVIAAPLAAFAELISRGGNDTFIVPLTASCLFALLQFLQKGF